jgi:hypothetical protein
MKRQVPHASPLVWTGTLLVWGAVALFFASLTLLSRAALELEGTVTFSETKCEGPTGHRCSTLYLVRSDLTGEITRYRAQGNDAALARRLPVGTHLRKEKWSFSYNVDRARIEDFPTRFYFVIMLVGSALLLAALWRFVHFRQWEHLARLGEQRSS